MASLFVSGFLKFAGIERFQEGCPYVKFLEIPVETSSR